MVDKPKLGLRSRFERWQRRSHKGALRRSAESGYNLLILMMLVLFVNLLLGAAMQKWSDRIQREKEEELIFRGLQYAEAIRVFQARFGRPPVKLEELVEMEPRSIRQLFPNPMADDGAWGLLLQSQRQGGAPGQAGQVPAGVQGSGPGQAGQGGLGQGRGNNRAGQAPQRVDTQTGPGNRRRSTGPGAQNQSGRGPAAGGVVAIPPSTERDTFGRRRQTQTTGPIVGVYAPVDEDGFHVFMNQTNISTWQFRVDMIPVPVIAGADSPVPRPNSGIFWRPFPPDLQPQMGNAPGQQNRGRELTGPGVNPALSGNRQGNQGGLSGSGPGQPPPRPRGRPDRN